MREWKEVLGKNISEIKDLRRKVFDVEEEKES